MHTKPILVIDTHSFVDVITNSSTELFVCDTEKTIAMVESILDMLIKVYGIGIEEYNKKNFNMSGDYENIFNVRIYTKQEYEKDIKSIQDPSNEWWNGYGYEKPENIGKILINGTTDNSIPYALFEVIETMFIATRYHEG